MRDMGEAPMLSCRADQAWAKSCRPCGPGRSTPCGLRGEAAARESVSGDGWASVFHSERSNCSMKETGHAGTRGAASASPPIPCPACVGVVVRFAQLCLAENSATGHQEPAGLIRKL